MADYVVEGTPEACLQATRLEGVLRSSPPVRVPYIVSPRRISGHALI
jgi:hypothetical protein